MALSTPCGGVEYLRCHLLFLEVYFLYSKLVYIVGIVALQAIAGIVMGLYFIDCEVLNPTSEGHLGSVAEIGRRSCLTMSISMSPVAQAPANLGKRENKTTTRW